MLNQQLSDCLEKIGQARQLFKTDPESSIEKADSALELYLKYLCTKHGDKDTSEIETKDGKKIPFNKWGIAQYLMSLEQHGVLTEYMKSTFWKVRNARNPVKHQNVQLNPRLIERAIAVVEYVVRYEIIQVLKEKYKHIKQSKIPEGGPFILPELRNQVKSRIEAKKWTSNGSWIETQSMGSYVRIHREDPYSKWELFEIKLRYLFKLLHFNDCIEEIEDFKYMTLGSQVDACGGSDGIFFVVDCTSKEELGPKTIHVKIRDILSKEKKIIKKIDNLYPNRYHTKIFIICTEDIEINDADKAEAYECDIRLLDNSEVDKWIKYYSTMGVSLRYHILKRLAGFSAVIIDEQKDPFLHYPSFRFEQDGKTIYHFLAEPENILKLAYVYRLEMGDPRGYQRDLKRKKILNINDFLSESSNYFANNIVVCFDSLFNSNEWPDFETQTQGKGHLYGTLNIPKIACTSEIIDGQHRLYGYLDSSANQELSRILERRRKNDRISIVAITDPEENERARLFADINSNQTRMDPRDVWVIMSKVRPKTMMGFTASLVIALNDGPVFRNRIHIPGKNTSKHKKLNIANFGKGLMDRRLVHKNKEYLWNLYAGDRNNEEYFPNDLISPQKRIEAFFNLFKKHTNLSQFIFSNNGANVILRIFVQLLKYEYVHNKKLDKSELNKDIVGPVLQKLPKENIVKQLKRTSSEAGRGDLAREIMNDIRKKPGMSSFAIEIFQ